MSNEQAKSELMQLYGVLSEEKKQAIDVAIKALQEQADRNEFYNWDAPIRHKADGEYILKSEAIRVASGYCHPSNIAKELEKLPSVDIPLEHDGCKDCKYETYLEYYYPCCECKHNYNDFWKFKPHWIDTGSGQECSECHEIQYGYDNHRFYCGNCGAKMD